MNTVGSLLICIIQVTFVTTAGILISLMLRTWLRTSAGRPLTISMLSVILLTLCAFSSWPSWLDQFPQPSIRNSQTELAQGFSSQHLQDSMPVVANTDPARSELFNAAAWSQWVLDLQRLALSDPDVAMGDYSTRKTWSWWYVLGLFIASFSVVGLFRFVGGLWGIRVFIRSSRPLTQPSLCEEVDLIRAEVGCSRTVRIRESSQLALAATVGWRRPVVLLSESWKTWTDAQLRSVLAHEIAHVARGDFLATMVAQLGLLLHFYHPLVHWLANQLRLEQELAADAMASQVVGGSQVYLRAISQLALSQSPEPVGWPVHTFLPTRRTFLRRMEMLRDLKSMSDRTPRVMQWGTTICVAAFTLVAVGFRPAGSDPVPPGFRDDFVEKYDDAWTVLNENAANISLTKKPGTLTITTQLGGIWRHFDNAKNIFLIDTPMKTGNFVMTTRLLGFDPQVKYQQAGLICFNDVDNYVKFGLEFDPGNGGKTLAVVPETDGIDHENAVLQVTNSIDELWLRVIRYDGKYIFSSSRDGKKYTTVVIQKCNVDYPSKVGILAKNGNLNNAPGIDASFDLFEIVPLATRPELEKLIKSEMEF